MHATTVNVVSATTYWHVGCHQLAIAIITDSLRWAAFGALGATTDSEHVERIQESVVFIEGTGLEALLETFGVGLHAQRLRDSYHRWLKQQTGPYTP